jgi:hypothetical protein
MTRQTDNLLFAGGKITVLIVASFIQILGVHSSVVKLRALSNRMRKIVNTAVKITPGEKTFYIKNPVKSLNIPRMTPNRSHILQLFSCIEITIIPA